MLIYSIWVNTKINGMKRQKKEYAEPLAKTLIKMQVLGLLNTALNA